MDALDCNVDKKHLLDILALLLWGENTTLEVTPFDSRFMKRLYKEILADLKSQIAYLLFGQAYRQASATVYNSVIDHTIILEQNAPSKIGDIITYKRSTSLR